MSRTSLCRTGGEKCGKAAGQRSSCKRDCVFIGEEGNTCPRPFLDFVVPPLPAASPRLPPVTASPPGKSSVPPLLVVVMPLVVAAIILSVVFARIFPAGAGQTAPTIRFTNITAEAGLRLPPFSGAIDSPTTLGGAVVVLDYNGDGAPDLLFVNGASWPWEEAM